MKVKKHKQKIDINTENMLKIGDELMEAMTSYLYKPFIRVTSSRKLDTVYTNNKNYPIQVNISVNFPANTAYRQANLYIDGTHVGAIFSFSPDRNIVNYHFIVAPGQSYEIVDPSGRCSIYIWAET